MSRKRCRVLVVDDEPAVREVLLARIERWGFSVWAASSVRQARELIAAHDPDVVISDLVLPDATGMDLLRVLQGDRGERVVFMITAYGTIDSAVEAIKLGATEFFTKPLDYVGLQRRLEEVEAQVAETTSDSPRAAAPDPGTCTGGMVGDSDALRSLVAEARLAARSDSPVLIVGESGTGKELVARTIHELSARCERPFVPVNSAAVPEALIEAEFFGFERGAFTGATAAKSGLFEQAEGGTLFLDEVAEMPIALQSKFLRVLEDGRVRRLGSSNERRFDVRVISATNRDPAAAVEEGYLRRDVLFRLDVLRIVVPPLRERLDDIAPLVHHFIGECDRRYGTSVEGTSEAALDRLRGHDWPGNIRELRNVVERGFVGAHGRVIEPEHLGLVGAGRRAQRSTQTEGIVIPHGVTAAEAERIVILETLKRTGNNKTETARRLGLDVKTVRNKLKTFTDWPS